MLDDETPLNVGHASCLAMIRFGHGQSRACDGRPEVAGYLTVADHVPVDRRGVYRMYTCPAHTGLVSDAEPMRAEDLAELEHRREQRLTLAGKPFERTQPLRT